MTIYQKKITIVLLPANPKFIKHYIKSNFTKEKGSWVYLGKNNFTCNIITSILGAQFTRIGISDDLQNIAINCKESYIEYIGSFPQTNDDLCWWITTISEKNSYVNDLYLYFCYLKLIMGYVQTYSGLFILICESNPLIQSLFNNLSCEKDIEIIYYNHSESLLEILKKKITIYILKPCWFLLHYSFRIFFSRILRLYRQTSGFNPNQQSRIVIHTWLDHRSFTDTFTFQDVYFGKLGQFLIEKGKNVVFLVNVLPSINFIQAIWYLKYQSEFVNLVEEFIHVKDLINAIKIIPKKIPVYPSPPKWIGLDVSILIKNRLELDRYNTRSWKAYLMYCAGKRMSSHYQISSFIYPFENHVWEKMFCMSFRRYSQITSLVGYAHSVVCSLYTGYNISKAEKKYAPIPDRIVVNGRESKNVLVRCGFTDVDIAVSGALRYEHHLDLLQSTKNKRLFPQILVTPSCSLFEALELIEKVILAFKNSSGKKIWIKLHPVLPLNQVLHSLPNFPNHITFVTSSVQELLLDSDLLIYTDTTVSLEALALGIPVIHVKSDYTIDINPLENYAIIPSTSDAYELYTISNQLLETDKSTHFRQYQKIVQDFFEPLHDDYVEIFLGKSMI